jgi:hypothetical protein
MCPAPENYVKVYLMGLAMSSTDDNDLEGLSLALNSDPHLIETAFEYWQAQGIVNVSRDPLTVEYLPVAPYSRQIKKYSKEKYKTFNDQLHKLIKDRVITLKEYDEYYNLMETLYIEDKALLTIIGYCIRLKGANITYPYILAVAKNLASQGCTSFERVSEKLSELDLYDDDLKAVIKTLGVKRAAEHSDKAMFIKWKNDFGFNPETIMQVAKQVKKGGISTLDLLLTRYYENRLLSIREINEFNENREKLYALTRKVLNILGLRYESLD